MKKWLIYAGIISILISFIPLIMIARERVMPKTETRLHLWLDMDAQQKFLPQSGNRMFADGRAMRRPIEGTVARGSLDPASPLASGRDAAGPLSTNPVPVTAALLARGRERFNIYCAPCHGMAGYGDGPVARRADRLQEGTWTPPSSLHSDLVRQQPDGQIFSTISRGIRTMPAYGAQVEVQDRWAIVAYVRALERSQAASVDDVPTERRESLK